MPNLLSYTLFYATLALTTLSPSVYASPIPEISQAELSNPVKDWIELVKIMSFEKAQRKQFEELAEKSLNSKTKQKAEQAINQHHETMHKLINEKRAVLSLKTSNAKQINQLMIEKNNIQAQLSPSQFFTADGIEKNKRLNVLNTTYHDQFSQIERVALAELKDKLNHTAQWITEWLNYKITLINIDQITIKMMNTANTLENTSTQDHIRFIHALSEIESSKLTEIKAQSPDMVKLYAYKQQYFNNKKIFNLNVIEPDSQNSSIYSDDFETLGQIQVKIEPLESKIEHRFLEYLEQNFMTN